jgi:hypothetical protein
LPSTHREAKHGSPGACGPELVKRIHPCDEVRGAAGVPSILAEQERHGASRAEGAQEGAGVGGSAILAVGDTDQHVGVENDILSDRKHAEAKQKAQLNPNSQRKQGL